MTSSQAHRIINTRERGTSTDINKITQLSDRNNAMAAWYAQANDTTLGGVITGMRISVSGTNVIVEKGLALVNDGATTYPDSDYRWIELMASKSISVSGDLGVADRWILIEISPGTTTSISAGVDVFDPTTGAFSTATLPKEVQSDPVLTATLGANANEFPDVAGPITDRIPLGYVYVSAIGVIGAGDTHVCHCRPMLNSKAPMAIETLMSSTKASKSWCQGGGINVASDGTTGSTLGIKGVFADHRVPFYVGPGEGISNITTTGKWDGAGVPGGQQNAYFYVAPPPYPDPYSGGLAPREFQVGDNARFQFNTMVTTAGNENQINCIIIGSTVGPNTTTMTPQGAPPAAATTCQDRPFFQGGVAPAINREDWVFLGAVDWDTNEMKAQDFHIGESRVVPLSRWPMTDVTLIGGINAQNPVNLRVGDLTLTDSGGLMPAHATSFIVSMYTEWNGPGEENLQWVDDQYANSLIGPLIGGNLQCVDSTGGHIPTRSYRTQATLIQSGGSVTMRRSTNLTVHQSGTLSYIDSIIASR